MNKSQIIGIMLLHTDGDKEYYSPKLSQRVLIHIINIDHNKYHAILVGKEVDKWKKQERTRMQELKQTINTMQHTQKLSP